MPLVIRLPADIEAGLRRLSHEEGRPQAEIVRALIAEKLSRRAARESPYAIARRLDVIGCDADDRTDTAARHAEYVRAALRSRRVRKSGAKRRG